MDSTSNSSVYNKARKIYLEQKGEISCSYCPYHRVENYRGKFYGGPKGKVTMPSWKLSTKNRKQWMDKNIKIEEKVYRWSKRTYFEVSWER